MDENWVQVRYLTSEPLEGESGCLGCHIVRWQRRPNAYRMVMCL